MDLRYLAPRVDFIRDDIADTSMGRYGNCYENLRRFRGKGVTFNSRATRLARSEDL